MKKQKKGLATAQSLFGVQKQSMPHRLCNRRNRDSKGMKSLWRWVQGGNASLHSLVIEPRPSPVLMLPRRVG